MKPIFTLIFTFILIKNGFAQSGSPDSSFGNNGKVVSETYEGRAYAGLLQPDGKILLGGSGTYYKANKLLRGSLLARYNTNGTLDVNFADSGRGVYILGDTGFYIPIIRSMALQPDGKIVALGDFAEQDGILGSTSLMRFNADGIADQSFGIGGLTVTGISGGPDQPRDLALLPDGRIIVVGDLYKNFYEFDHSFIACYTSNGVLDKNFGDKGIVVLPDQVSGVNSVTITANGKIIVGGVGFGGEALVRYNNDGTPDISFGENGVARMSFGKNGYPGLNDIVIDKDGKITTGGTFYLQNGRRAILISRFTEDGFPDINFNNNGYIYTLYNTGSAFGNCLAIQENGKIVAGGYSLIGDSATFTMIRYNTNGSIDSGFGTNGSQNTFFYGQDIAYSINIQPNGKIILAGHAELEAKTIIEVARYYGDESPRQILITKLRRWLQHHNGIVWDNLPGAGSYAIQRSSNGVAWSTVRRQQSTVNGQRPTANSYADPSPLPGTNYYRLQTTSVDGAVAYSNVVAINNELSVISISPNPAKSVLRIEGLPASAKTKITVANLAGNVACSVQLEANGASSHNLNTAALKPGNYLLRIEAEGEVVTKQFVKE